MAHDIEMRVIPETPKARRGMALPAGEPVSPNAQGFEKTPIVIAGSFEDGRSPAFLSAGQMTGNAVRAVPSASAYGFPS